MTALLILTIAVIMALCFCVVIASLLVLGSYSKSQTDKPHHSGGAFK